MARDSIHVEADGECRSPVHRVLLGTVGLVWLSWCWGSEPWGLGEPFLGVRNPEGRRQEGRRGRLKYFLPCDIKPSSVKRTAAGGVRTWTGQKV